MDVVAKSKFFPVKEKNVKATGTWQDFLVEEDRVVYVEALFWDHLLPY
jgi:hypothetical protein